MDPVDEVTNKKFVLILLGEKKYDQKLSELIKGINSDNKGICYVCLNKPYSYVIEDLKSKGVATNKFSFVDVLSSHYEKPKEVNNCTFVDSPDNLEGIKVAISSTVLKKDTKIIIFDSISSMLSHNKQHKILKFTNDLCSDHSKSNKVYLYNKEDGILYDEKLNFAKDLELFVDSTLDLNSS